MKNLYEEVTRRIVEQLDKGVIPWKSPYFSTVGFPTNFSTGQNYRGINVLLLASARFTSPFFLTFLQAKELGGNVRKGERGYLVVKYGTYSKEEHGARSDEDSVKRGYLKGYTVFHSTQIEGIDFPEPEGLPDVSMTERTEKARQIIDSMPKRPEISEGSAVPCYRPGTDSVHMPAKNFFHDEIAYFSTLFHELSHATGHVSRLARKSLTHHEGIKAIGDTSRQAYAEEELVAEMTASFLKAHSGFPDEELENSAAYVKGWADTLRRKDSSSWVIRAASEAQKASDFILGRF